MYKFCTGTHLMSLESQLTDYVEDASITMFKNAKALALIGVWTTRNTYFSPAVVNSLCVLC